MEELINGIENIDITDDYEKLQKQTDKNAELIKIMELNILELKQEITIIENNTKVVNIFKDIISIMNNNQDIIEKYHYYIQKILKQFPPRKNENKIMYGKLIEETIKNMFNEINISYIDLDEHHEVGSSYKNDAIINGIHISIKAKKQKNGNIIMINKNSNNIIHNVKDINILLIIIEEQKIYFIPSFCICYDEFIKNNESNISYKSKMIKYFCNNYQYLIYSFPELSKKYLDNLNNIDNITITDLYNIFVNI